MPNKTQSPGQSQGNFYVVMLPLWCDDVSGNCSKQYKQAYQHVYGQSKPPWTTSSTGIFCLFLYLHRHMHHLPNNLLLSWTKNNVGTCVFPLVNIISHAAFSATHKDPIRCFQSWYTDYCACSAEGFLTYQPTIHNNLRKLHTWVVMQNCKSCKSTKGGPHEIMESNKGYHELYTVSLLTFITRSGWRVLRTARYT